MFWQIVIHNIMRRRWRKFLAAAIMWVSAGLIAALMIGALAQDHVIRARLQQFGPNFVILPDPARPDVTSLPMEAWQKLASIFWWNNIVAVVPARYTQAHLSRRDVWVPALLTWFDHTERVGARQLAMGWKALAGGWDLVGTWPDHPHQVLIGRRLAGRLGIAVGDDLQLRIPDLVPKTRVKVRGIFTSGGVEDHHLMVSLDLVRDRTPEFFVHRFYVRAETVPEPAVPLHPEVMSPAEYDRWYCTPYPSSIAYQIEEVLPRAAVYPMEQVLYQESAHLRSVRSIVILLTIAVAVAMSAGIALIMVSLVQARSYELMLFQVLGATRRRVAALFLSESLLVGLLTGILGWLTGGGLVPLISGLPTGPPWAYPEVGLTVVLVTVLLSGLATWAAVAYRWNRTHPQLLHQAV